jgi:hypothetical protein
MRPEVYPELILRLLAPVRRIVIRSEKTDYKIIRHNFIILIFPEGSTGAGLSL